ncbi:hypothetical protein, partial [Candidatus Villigracilis saccharophilus]|uniref:hypothetical protein n=1 Tax=Candidatus Villigracilis saccharophilus TaxID=3140684 RepID=UPI0031F0A86B
APREFRSRFNLERASSWATRRWGRLFWSSGLYSIIPNLNRQQWHLTNNENAGEESFFTCIFTSFFNYGAAVGVTVIPD